PDGQPTLLPPDQSTGEVTQEALQVKLKVFLELHTADGPHHNTYVVFYNSPRHGCRAPGRPQLGDFTSQWAEYNCNSDSAVQLSERGRTVTAIYGISKHWIDYTLHLPTGSDITKHWRMYFPRMTYPVPQLVSWFCGLNLLCLCSICL
ncbi:unnamed protein product, partial [Coregonus sp. 'balchen']